MEKFTANDVNTIRNAMEGKQPAQNDNPAAQPTNGGAAAGAPSTQGANAPKDNGQPSGPPKNDNGSGAGAPAPVTGTFDIKELGFNSPDELKGRLTKIQEYEKQLEQLNEYKAGPKFKSDRHKFLYEVGDRSEGMELSAVRQFLEVVELLDQKDVPDQRLRFEAFKMRPENKVLSQDEIRTSFLAEETERYGNPQDTANPPTELQQIRAKQATALAKETLQKVKNDWDATRPVAQSPEELALEKREYVQFLNDQLKGFDGIPQIKLQATDESGEKLEGTMAFKIDPEKQLPRVVNAIADPQGWFDQTMERLGIMVPGSKMPDFKKWGDFITRFEFQEDLLNQAYQQGQSDLKARQLKTARNVADPTNGGDGGSPPVQPVNEKKAANQAAMKVAGLV